MLFTSPLFAFIYFPIVFIGFYAIGYYSSVYAAVWLFIASILYYAYWMPEFTALLLSSICWNYWVGSRISTLMNQPLIPNAKTFAKTWLVSGIVINLLLLGYFKYANFFIENLEQLTHKDLHIEHIILPIGISFFTFTQIAFLADTFQKGTREYAFIHYGLFVTYFPHLIAGPILHHNQMMPQFREAATYKIDTANLTAGLTIFMLGLGKKVFLADGISPYADALFNAAETGAIPDFTEAWLGALAYTFQLYFDFSGYSDMAIGLSWMFNIRLPFNFNSPYKATSIIDFWRRWHITLSVFLRDYLYIPLGGNRKGTINQHINLFVTMLLGGLWHGASWNFIFWGGLHGLYLSFNHVLRYVSSTFGDRPVEGKLRLAKVFSGWLVTFLLVVIAWVFFRATNFVAFKNILAAMVNFNAISPLASIHPLLWNQGLVPEIGLGFCMVLSFITFLLPNSNQIGNYLFQVCHLNNPLRPILLGAAITFSLVFIVINSLRNSVSPFIYFNF